MRFSCVFSGPSVLGLSVVMVTFVGTPEHLERPMLGAAPWATLDGMTVPSQGPLPWQLGRALP